MPTKVLTGMVPIEGTFFICAIHGSVVPGGHLCYYARTILEIPDCWRHAIPPFLLSSYQGHTPLQ